jgi:hypothetical protein
LLQGREPIGKSIVIEYLELVLIQVKAGSFTMGSLPSERQRDKAEGQKIESPLATCFGLVKRKTDPLEDRASPSY